MGNETWRRGRYKPIQEGVVMKAYIISFLVETILPRLLSWAAEVIPSLAESAVQDIIQKIKEKKAGINMSASVKINVKNSADILVGATVLYSGGEVSNTTITDSAGQATVSGLPAGAYTFTASMTGYTASSESVSLADGASSELTITLTAAATESTQVQAVETAVATAIATASSGTASVSEDWKTIKAAAEASVTSLSSSVSTSDLTSSTALTGLYSQVTSVIQTAITKVEAYKSQLMISRHTKSFGECLLIDAKLAGITIFEYYVSKEVNAAKAKIEAKISSLS
jgi:hypothetical protein